METIQTIGYSLWFDAREKFYKIKEEKIDIASYLIDCGIDVKKNGDISDSNLIRSVAKNGHIDMIELLYNNETVFDVSAL